MKYFATVKIILDADVESDDDDYEGVPLWKKALMKKRAEEQRQKDVLKQQEVE